MVFMGHILTTFFPTATLCNCHGPSRYSMGGWVLIDGRGGPANPQALSWQTLPMRMVSQSLPKETLSQHQYLLRSRWGEGLVLRHAPGKEIQTWKPTASPLLKKSLKRLRSHHGIWAPVFFMSKEDESACREELKVGTSDTYGNFLYREVVANVGSTCLHSSWLLYQLP